MVNQSLDKTELAQGDGAKPRVRKPYRRPVLTKMGTLRDMTNSNNGGGAADGMPSKGTQRGGNFDSSDCSS